MARMAPSFADYCLVNQAQVLNTTAADEKGAQTHVIKSAKYNGDISVITSWVDEYGIRRAGKAVRIDGQTAMALALACGLIAEAK